MTNMMNTNNPKLSVAIPTHEMKDGERFFKRCLDSLWNQTFQDFEIVVTDNSDNEVIENICKEYGGIRYIRNPEKGMAPNTNCAIKNSKGELIKILYMDDYLLHNKVLAFIAKKGKWSNWIINGSDNNFAPCWTEDIHLGNNKLGSPSTLTMINEDPPLFDENLTWLLDCDLYKRLYERYGEPYIMVGNHIGIGVGDHQMTHLISNERKLQEHDYLTKKYE